MGVGFSNKYDAMGETLTLSVKREILVFKSRELFLCFSLALEKNNQEKKERFESIKSSSLPPSLRPTVASTDLSLNSISLEVLGSYLRVDTVRDEPKTWFISG